MTTLLSHVSQWLGPRQTEQLITYAAILDLVVSAVLAGAALSFLVLFLVQSLRALIDRRQRDMVNRLLWALAMIALFTFALAGAINSVDSLA